MRFKIIDTLHKFAPITNTIGDKPSLMNALKVAAIVTPIGMTIVGTDVLAKAAIDHKAQILPVLQTIKTGTVKTADTIGTDIKHGAKVVSSGLESFLMPVMVVGGLVLAIMVLK